MASASGREPSQYKTALLALAGTFALLAAWFGWSGWQQWSQRDLQSGLEQARDGLVASVQGAIRQQTLALDTALKAVAAQGAAGADDAQLAQAVQAALPKAQGVQAFDADLGVAYADPGTFGFAKLALLEGAQRAGKTLARVVRDGGKPQLGVAGVVGTHVVYVPRPLSLLTLRIADAQVPAPAYLGLRQGNYKIGEKGDASLSGSADQLARVVGDSGLRVVAALPDLAVGPFGLGAIGTLGAAAGCVVVALLVALAALGRLKFEGVKKEKVDKDEDGAQTLGQVMSKGAAWATQAKAKGIGADRSDEDGALAAAELVDEVEVDPTIFRAYDIRGVVGKALSPQVAERIGLAIGTLMHEKDLSDIVVGRDGRLSGPELQQGLVEGLRLAGRNVIDIGMVPTPVAYYAAQQLKTGCCVAVTGSHNPPDYNGFKIVVGDETLSGAAITDLFEKIESGRLHFSPNKRGTLEQRDVVGDYVQRIADDVQLERPIKVVIDAGNGVAGEVAPRLLDAIGADAIPLYCDVDGTFPNHHPDPSEPRNLEDLISTVKRFEADLGLAFDGDGDRLGVVTREGEIIFPDRTLMLFASDVLGRNPGAMVIYDVKCTGKLQQWVLRHGGTPLMWQTGHSLIKAKMKETGAELAGEMSGHFFFEERWFGFDDGLYSAARLLEILASRTETPSEVFAQLPSSVSTPEIKVPVESDPHALVKQFVANARFSGANLTTIDGLRADWEDGWGLLRASNTTPVLVLRFEGDSEDALERIKMEFRLQLQKIAPGLAMAF